MVADPVFMLLKAGLIVAVFMHMAWERLALIYAILLPPIAVLVFVAIMALEANYTLVTRMAFFPARRSPRAVIGDSGQMPGPEAAISPGPDSAPCGRAKNSRRIPRIGAPC